MTKYWYKHWPYILTGLWITLLMSIGIWWLYLIVYLDKQLQELSHSSQGGLPQTLKAINVVEMAKWEGMTFFLLLGLVSFFLISFYVKDMKKGQSMQVFFAAISHELKTPSASMRLQAEVIKEQLSQNPSYQNGDLAHLLHRLVEDSYRLEHELEQILQLARVEREAGLSLRTFDLEQLVKQIIKKEFRPYVGKMEYTVLSSSSEEQSPSQDLDKIVLLDDFALKMILRNLLENTFKYATDKKIKLSFFYEKKFLILQYQDTHLPSNEDIPHYVQLFYTTGKGSGIGLYIIKKLMEQMRGKLKIINQPYLAFQLFFPLTNKRNAIEISS